MHAHPAENLQKQKEKHGQTHTQEIQKEKK